jgi:hypothetical protein
VYVKVPESLLAAAAGLAGMVGTTMVTWAGRVSDAKRGCSTSNQGGGVQRGSGSGKAGVSRLVSENFNAAKGGVICVRARVAPSCAGLRQCRMSVISRRGRNG